MVRALITGITGQDGSYLAEFLLNKGYHLFGLTRPIEKDENIKHIKDRLHLLNGDLQSEEDIKNALIESDPDEVYNLGALTHVGLSFKEPVLFGDVTGLSVSRMLESIRKFNPKIKFYQASTSELYGNSKEEKQNEDTLMNPTSPYAIAKMYAYQMVKLYRNAYGMYAVNGILFNHESERRGLNFVTRKISNAVAQIRLGLKKDNLILGNTSSKRDWGYAKEYVEVMWMMLQMPKPDDYVIGTGQLHSVQDFVEEAFSYVDLDWKKWVEISDNYKRPSDVNYLRADITKAKKVLNWKPKIKFKELVKIMVDEDIKKLRYKNG